MKTRRIFQSGLNWGEQVPDEEMKLPAEWEEVDGIHVHDADGWRSTFKLSKDVIYHAQSWDVPITYTEWKARMSVSSVIGVSQR